MSEPRANDASDWHDLSNPQLHVLTGGPGSGKTTLLAALKKEGFEVMPESGRAIIQAEVEQAAATCLGRTELRSPIECSNAMSLPGTKHMIPAGTCSLIAGYQT